MVVVSLALSLITPIVFAADPVANWFNPPEKPAAGVLHASYHSQAMDEKVGYSIFLPPGYDASSGAAAAERYPVLYFLHGRGGHESSPYSQAILPLLRQGIENKTLPPMIVVFPCGGQHTVYCDSVDGKYKAQFTIIHELIPHIDQTYRTVATREGRAIQGMSMGGCGAFQLAMKHPELFSSALAYAGGFVDAETMNGRVKMICDAMFGGDAAKWMQENPVTLCAAIPVEQRAKLPLRLICGTTDISLGDTLRMRGALQATGWDHDYLEYAGIPHDFIKLIAVDGDAGLKFAAQHFAKPAGP